MLDTLGSLSIPAEIIATWKPAGVTTCLCSSFTVDTILFILAFIEVVVEFTVLDIPVTYALLLGRPWYHVLGGVPSTVHQKVKFLLDREVITIDASMSKTVSAVRDEQKQVVAPPGFPVAMISARIERNPRVSSMIKKMSYRSGKGLGKNE